MNDDAKFWALSRQMATNLGLTIQVVEGRPTLRHLFHQGDAKRPTDEAVETFRDFLRRHKERILRANGITTVNPYAEDARNLFEWLKANRSADNGVVEGPKGGPFVFTAELHRLLNGYDESPKWILEAVRFQQAVLNQTSWRPL
jgi:hypothetical protein